MKNNNDIIALDRPNQKNEIDAVIDTLETFLDELDGYSHKNVKKSETEWHDRPAEIATAIFFTALIIFSIYAFSITIYNSFKDYRKNVKLEKQAHMEEIQKQFDEYAGIAEPEKTNNTAFEIKK